MSATDQTRGAYIQTERDGRVLTITINRPEAMNALMPAAMDEMVQAFDWLEADPELWVGILTASGDRAFCAGLDLKWAAQQTETIQVPSSGFGGLTARYRRVKPIIAAVNGAAMGGGFELVLACELAVASRTARFGSPEPKVGQIAAAGGLHRLPRSIPMKRAMDLLLTGRSIDAEEALAWGLVNEVVEPGEVLAAARRWAELIIANSPMSIRFTMEQAIQGLDVPSLAEAVTRSWPLMDAGQGCHDEREGPTAFAEKRPPRWRLETM